MFLLFFLVFTVKSLDNNPLDKLFKVLFDALFTALFKIFHLKPTGPIDVSLDGTDLRSWVSQLFYTQDKIVYNTSILNFELDNLSISDPDLVDIKAIDLSTPEQEKINLTALFRSFNITSPKFTAKIGIIPYTCHFTVNTMNLSIGIPITFNRNDKRLVQNVTIKSDDITVIVDHYDIHSDSFILEHTIQQAIPYIIQQVFSNNVANIFNVFLSNFTDIAETYIALKESNSLPEITSFDPADIKDLRQYSVVDALRFLLNVFFAPGGEKLDINWIVDKLTNFTGDFYLSRVQNLPLNISFGSPDVGQFNLSIFELTVSGLDTFHDFDFLKAVNGYTFDSTFGIWNASANLMFGVAAQLYDTSSLSASAVPLSIIDNVSLALNNNDLSIQLQAVSPKDYGSNYTDSMCMDMSCIAAIFSANDTKANTLQADSSFVDFEIISKDANDTHHELEDSAYEAIHNLTVFAKTHFSDVGAFYYHALFSLYAVPAFNTHLSEEISAVDCEYSEYHMNDSFNLYVTLVAIAVCIATVLIIYIVICFAEPCRNQIRFRKLKDQAQNGELIVYSLSTFDGSNEFEQSGFLANIFRNDSKGSLMMNKKIPIVLRMLMPFLIFVNVAIFVSSNVGIGIRILVKIYLSEESVIQLPSLFDFYLLKSVNDIWVNNGKLLATLITIYSIIWPYTKLILMLLVWILPTVYLNKNRRETIIKVLDALGKWSFFDTFVMSLIIVAFGLVLEFPIQDPQCKEPLRCRLLTVPEYSFYTLALGTLFSLFLSHFMLALHRYAEDVLDDNPQEDRKQSLFNIVENVFYRHIITILIVVNFALYAVGIQFDAFVLYFVGFVGYVMTLLNIQNENGYSIFNIAPKYPNTSDDPNSFGIRFVQTLYILIVLVIPFLHIIGLFILWCIPFKKKTQIFLYKACEVLYSWASLDVLSISLLGVLTEVANFAKNLATGNCGAFNTIIAEYFYDLPFVTGHELCFDAYITFSAGAWILLVGAVLQNYLTITINIYGKKALYKEENKTPPISMSVSNDTLLSAETGSSTRLV